MYSAFKAPLEELQWDLRTILMDCHASLGHVVIWELAWVSRSANVVCPDGL